MSHKLIRRGQPSKAADGAGRSQTDDAKELTDGAAVFSRAGAGPAYEAVAIATASVEEPLLEDTDPGRQSLRDHLEQVLASAAFRSSKRCTMFLRYVVCRTLEGQTHLLKERILGAEVFGRPADYDTSADHIVRSAAGETRKRLAQYYLDCGRASGIRIDIPPGSYVPQFRPSDWPTAAVAPSESATLRPAPARWSKFAIGIAAVLCLAVAGSAARHFVVGGNPVDRFWSPLFDSADPIAICVGDPRKAWNGSELSAFNTFRPVEDSSAPLPFPVPPATLPNHWFYRTVPFGDAVTLSRLTALITGRRKDFRTVYTPDSTLSDLRQNSSLLIGGIDNFWSMSFTRDLRYRFQVDPQSKAIFVEDRRTPSRHGWQVGLDELRNGAVVDYAIVARLVHPATGRLVVIAGGIRDSGTLAAGEFLTSAESLAELERRSPSKWTNVEVVLATKVFKGTPGPPQILAAEFW